MPKNVSNGPQNIILHFVVAKVQFIDLDSYRQARTIDFVESPLKPLYYIAVCCTFIFASAAFGDEDIVSWKSDIKGWDILVDRTIGNGCFMYTIYEQGTFLRVQFNPNSDDLEFIIGNSDWKSLERGKLYPMSVQFGNQSPWSGNGSVFYFDENSPSLVLSVPFEDDRASRFINELMQMTSLKVSYEDKQISHLSLRGTYAAMEEVFSCQTAMLKTSSSDDPFSSGGATTNDPFQ